MKWALIIVGAALAVGQFYWTMTINGLTILGLLILMWGTALMVRDDINDGL